MTVSISYACPRCRQPVAPREEPGYVCSGCSAEYPVEEGIPIFGNTATYYGEVSREEMAKLSAVAKERGYEEAIKQFVKDPFVVTYILDERRALWAELLPLSDSTDVLDVGCGWGTNVMPIARRARLVAAVDATIERVTFVKLRAEQNGLDNVCPSLASATALPFPEASFDVVAFNGVLEWLGAIDEQESPLNIQKLALREAHRVLKPGGLVYIGIENRYSLAYFLGFPDDHSFIRFTSLMPRRLAQVYFKLRTGKNYFMHTHSLPAYRRMLREEGFGPGKEFLPWPNYRNPQKFVPLRRESILELLRADLQETARFSRRGMYLSLLKALTALEGCGRFCHSYIFLYEKKGQYDSGDHSPIQP